MPRTNGEPWITPKVNVGASVPIHFATAIVSVCPRVPPRATSMAMNSTDISRFCRNAAYTGAALQPNSLMNSSWTVKPMINISSAHPGKEWVGDPGGAPARPYERNVETITASATNQTRSTTPCTSGPSLSECIV